MLCRLWKEERTGHCDLRVSQTEHILIEIADNGIGIPENYWEKVFIPFSTNLRGLELASQPMQANHPRQHQGISRSMGISQPGETTFVIELP